MSDLNKLMKKLKKEEPTKATPEEKEPKIEELDDDEDKEDQLPRETKPIPTPSNIDEPNPIEQEVAILQNDGIFRRELISSIRELVDVMKVNTQALLDIKKIAQGDDGKKN